MKIKLTIASVFILVSIATFWACKDEEQPIIENSIELTISEDTTSYVFAKIICTLSEIPKFTVEQHGFCWDTVTGTTIEKESNSFGNLTSQNFQKNIENLLPNKTYYVKGYIQNGDVVIYSNELSIQTKDARPVVITSDITKIEADEAESGGTVSSYEALFPITKRGVCWSEATNPTISDSLTTDSIGNGTFVSQIQNLDAGIIYYVRAYAVNSEGISYGEEKSFSTLDGIPELTTDSVNDITAVSAAFYGNIIENDGLEIIEKGFCWNTGIGPTVENNYQVVNSNALGNYAAEISDLDINTNYYVKAYIKNSEGTFYSDNEISFTTNDGIPDITTKEITDITVTTAASGGEITDDGGFEITARGVCWSTSQNPTVSNDTTYNSTGTGCFTSSLTELNVNTTYYVCAYATNSSGTSYGEQKSFKTYTGTLTDNDGNSYYTVTIGTQIWMEENLKTTKYNDGTDIPHVTDNAAWKDLTTAAYCWYDNDTDNKNTYGALYNWYAVETDKLCPTGWHVPTDDEWKTLEKALGMTQAQADSSGGRGTPVGSKLASNKDLWKDGDLETNSKFGTSGFAALPGGFRSSDGSFSELGVYGYWCTATEYSSSNVWQRMLFFGTADVYRSLYLKSFGRSVRCVKD